MSEPVPALNGVSFDGFARIEELAPRGMIVLCGDLTIETFRKAVRQAIPAPLRASGTGDDAVCWMSTDELLLMCPYVDVSERMAHLTIELAGTHHLIADVSDARSVFRLSGRGLRETLAKLTPADMAPDTFRPGHFRRTRLAQAPAAVWLREPEVAEVLCFRSVARYVFDLLSNAAKPGTEPDYWHA